MLQITIEGEAKEIAALERALKDGEKCEYSAKVADDGSITTTPRENHCSRRREM